MNKNYIRFTKDMKRTHTILIPNMLPVHFKFIRRIMENDGYHVDLLETSGPHIAEIGQKYVHNDTCYPAILVIGQMLDALFSGKYDPRRTAIMLFQTGGGCRASNYVSLMRKALVNAGMEYVPVLPLSLAGIERHPGFRNSISLFRRMAYAVLCGDLMMALGHQARPYETEKGSVDRLTDEWTERLVKKLSSRTLTYRGIRTCFSEIARDYAAVPMERRSAPQVGIVGEIYVKFSPLGNNNLERFLESEGAEVTLPGLLDFFLYCVYNTIAEYDLYPSARTWIRSVAARAAFRFLLNKQRDMIEAIRETGVFKPMTPFEKTLTLTKDFIGYGTKMGEGWLLSAEMLELCDAGVTNIVCTQPFGCLPNHICGKGMMKPIKEAVPGANIVAIDYDPGASAVNQENRLRLMLAAAREALDASSEQTNG